MTSTCEGCGIELSVRTVERGFRRCYQCYLKKSGGGNAPTPSPHAAHTLCAPDLSARFIPVNNMTLPPEPEGPKEGDEIDGWTLVSRYTTEDAVRDGVIVPVGYIEPRRDVVFFTSNLLRDYEDEAARRELIERGLRMLAQPDEEDSAYMRLRVLEKGEAWVIQEHGKYTFMKPEDY